MVTSPRNPNAPIAPDPKTAATLPIVVPGRTRNARPKVFMRPAYKRLQAGIIRRTNGSLWKSGFAIAGLHCGLTGLDELIHRVITPYIGPDVVPPQGACDLLSDMLGPARSLVGFREQG